MNDGGPAFARPASEYTRNGTCPDGNDARDAQGGMSLRDWFAGQALAAIVSKTPLSNWTPAGERVIENSGIDRTEADSYEYKARTARGAYAYADAMLAARGGK